MAEYNLFAFSNELKSELHSILDWWLLHMKDPAGGFYGEINLQNEINEKAPKGLVLTSRMLWTFSIAYRNTKNIAYLEMADCAYKELIKYFYDQDYGGYYWSINSYRQPIQSHKQIYGQSFVLYGLVEYADATKNSVVLRQAVELFNLIQEKGYDFKYGGYWDACGHDWSMITDARLSEKDPNVAKSMNTHLHILEAYTRLAKSYPDKRVIQALNNLLTIFKQSIINKDTFRQHLYFNTDWSTVGAIESFGHDIECSWLLLEAASVQGLENRKQEFTNLILSMATNALKAVDQDGGMFYEFDYSINHLNKEKHWWVQAEAMVGFYNAWEVSKDEKYLAQCLRSWEFIKAKICDRTNGEWFWGVNEKNEVLDLPKAGFWKCPYHNVRSCIEIYNRINKNI